MRFGADSTFRSVPSVLKVSIGTGGPSLQPIMWMFIAILATFLITRTVTRLIRSGSGAGAGLGNVRLAGVHVHHQVFGILIIIGTGIVLVSAAPHGAALDVAAALFGVGVSLTLDEFALWLHLQDVYWTTEGRKSVDAIFCVLAVTGALVGGTTFLSGHVGTAAWWSSVSVLSVDLMLSVICLLKGKVTTGVIGTVISGVAFVGAVRLAKPGSWWATHRYASQPQRAARAAPSLRPALPAALESVAGSRGGRPLRGPPALGASAEGAGGARGRVAREAFDQMAGELKA